MPVTITTDPSHAIAGRACRIIPAGVAGNVQRLRIVAAPQGSSFYRADGSEVEVATRTDYPTRIGAETIVFTPDIGGQWTVAIEDRQVGASSGRPSYAGSPKATAGDTLLSRTELTLSVGQQLTKRIGTQEHAATLVVHVKGGTIVQTDAATYGFDSPRLESPTSFIASQAMQDGYVSTDLASMVGADVSNAKANSDAVFSHLVTVLRAHAADTGIHNGLDGYTLDDLDALGGYGATPERLNRLRNILAAHMLNTNGNWHDDAPDTVNLPANATLAELHRAYEAHRVQTSNPDSHSSADNTNAAGALPDFLGVESSFNAAIANLTGPTTANDGAVQLASQGYQSSGVPSVVVKLS